MLLNTRVVLLPHSKVLVHNITHNLGYRIFTYTSQPSPDRTHVMQTLYNVDVKQSVSS